MIWTFLRPFVPYIIGAVALAIVSLSGALWWQTGRVDSLTAQNAALTLQLGACKASAENIKQDAETDNEVDNIPDDGLRDAPDRWMLQPGAGGLY